MDISGRGRNKVRINELWDRLTRDEENYREVDGKLETTDRSRWLEDDERIIWDTDTGEVRVVKRNV